MICSRGELRALSLPIPHPSSHTAKSAGSPRCSHALFISTAMRSGSSPTRNPRQLFSIFEGLVVMEVTFSPRASPMRTLPTRPRRSQTMRSRLY